MNNFDFISPEDCENCEDCEFYHFNDDDYPGNCEFPDCPPCLSIYN